MSFLKTVASWAGKVLGFVAGIPGDIGAAISSVYHYVTSVHNLFSWIVGSPVVQFALHTAESLDVFRLEINAVHDLLARLDGWLWNHRIRPVRDQLAAAIARLRAWAVAQLAALRFLVIKLYDDAIAFADRLVTAERAARVKADQAEAAARVRGDKATLATVQQQAASGYNTGLHDRGGIVNKLLDGLANRQPEIRGLVSTLVKGIIDLEEIDNPVARLLLGRVITEVIDKLGVDQVAGQLAGRLLGPLLDHGRASDLYEVERDVSDRLGALEAQWADFMADGGPEVEQAGREWRDLTGVAQSAALLGFFALAVTDPAAWATGVADTVGTAGNAALGGIVDLIGRP